MEAATPLRSPRVACSATPSSPTRSPCATASRSSSCASGAARATIPAELLVDAIEIGARVLSREQAEVNADFVRTEFEKVSREVEGAFTEKAELVAELLGKRVDDVFAPENGHLGEGARAAVRRRVRRAPCSTSCAR